jgi:hypothetical protein
MPKPKWSEIPQGYDVLVYNQGVGNWVAYGGNYKNLEPRYYGPATKEERDAMQSQWRWGTRWDHIEDRPDPYYIIVEKLDSILEGIDWIKDWLRNG